MTYTRCQFRVDTTLQVRAIHPRRIALLWAAWLITLCPHKDRIGCRLVAQSGREECGEVLAVDACAAYHGLQRVRKRLTSSADAR